MFLYPKIVLSNLAYSFNPICTGGFQKGLRGPEEGEGKKCPRIKNSDSRLHTPYIGPHDGLTQNVILTLKHTFF